GRVLRLRRKGARRLREAICERRDVTRHRHGAALQGAGGDESRSAAQHHHGSGAPHAAQGDDGGRVRGVAAVRDPDGRRSRAAAQVHRGEREVRAESGRVSSSTPAFVTRCDTSGSGLAVSLSATTIAWPSASNPSLIPAGSRANTDAIGSPASTLSPGFTVITKPTVGSTWSSTVRRPPPIATTARPTTFGSTWTTTPVRGALYTSTSLACGSTDA